MSAPTYDLQSAEVTIRPRYGTLSDRDKRAIVLAVAKTNLGQLRIDEAIVYNASLRGPGGLPITIDLWVTAIEAGLLADATSAAIRPIVKVLKRRLGYLTIVVHRDEDEPALYVVDDVTEAHAALEAIPADFEIMTHTNTHIRAWRNGRWEKHESRRVEPRTERRKRPDRRKKTDRRR